LYHSVADKLSLWQDEPFALAVTDSSSSLRFLAWESELGDQNVKDGMKLHVVVRYGKTPFRWADSVAAKFFATAMNGLIASGRLHVAPKQAIQMAALQVVIRFGSGVAKTKTSFLTNELLSQFLSPEVLASSPLDYLQQRVLFYYRKFTEKKHEHVVFDAAVRYNEMGREFCLGWGAHILTGTVGSESADLGIVEDGLIFRPKSAQSSETAFIAFHQAELTHEQGSTTLKFKHSGEKYKFECSSKIEAAQFYATAQSLQYILAKQGVEHYSASALPSDDTPYFVNYTRPIDRKKQADELKPSKSSKKASLLSVFQQAYIKKCQVAQMKPLNRLLLQLDTKLDQGEVHDSLDLRRCNLDDAALSIVYDAVEEVMALVASAGKGGKKYKKDFDPKKLLVSANDRLDTSQAICKLMTLCGLTTIDAADCSLTADAARHLASCLKQTSTLQELILDRNLDVTAAGIKNLLDVLRSQQQFKNLSLACCGITKEAEDDIKLFFEHTKSLQSINLADNKIGDAAMQAILQAAEKAKGTLVSLNFTNTAMGKKSADALKTFLEGEDKITEIKIGYNTFPSSVGKVIADIIPEGDILEEMDISSIGIGSKATAPIITALASNKTIKRLNLSGNPIDKDLSDSLEKLLSQNDHIEYLSLRNCGLDKVSMIKIAKAVGHNKTLRELDLSGNRLDSVEALESWTTSLISNTNLKTIYFAACKMDASCCEVFSEVLSENKTLERLHLDGNSIGKGVAYLADGLAVNRTLRFLTLQEASLRQDYLEEFLKRFSGSSGLELLDVRRNKFKDTGALQKLADTFAHLDLKF
jgi:Ran GTPase-activating protein (RanGAP) involved in mRNA processing and transport